MSVVTFYDTSGKICVSNKTKDVNLNVFHMITGVNESKSLKNIFHLTVHINLIVENVK